MSPKGEGQTARAKLLLQSNGSVAVTTTQLFIDLEDLLNEHEVETRVRVRTFPRGVAAKLKTMIRSGIWGLKDIVWCDALVVHTALSLSLPEIVAARLLGKRIVAFVWDLYPESTVAAGTMSNPAVIAAYSAAEKSAFALAHTLYVPSEDYLSGLGRHSSKARVFPLWGSRSGQTDARVERPNHQRKVVFAGQLNPIRSLGDAIHDLAEYFGGSSVVLTVYSADPLPQDAINAATKSSNVELKYEGYVQRAELEAQLGEFDYGLVALDRKFELPAFPSKIVAYVSVGLPVLYSGPRLTALTGFLSRFSLGSSISGPSPSGKAASRTEYLEGRSRYYAEIDKSVMDLIASASRIQQG